MAATVAASKAYDLAGGALKEDLQDIIYDISPMDTIFLTRAARTTVKSTTHEWLTDSLTAAARNAKISARQRARAAGAENPASGSAASERSALNMWALAALGLAGGAAAAVAPGRAERAAGQPAAAPGDDTPGTALEQAQAALPSAAGSALSLALESLVEQLVAEAAARPVPVAGGDVAAAEVVPGMEEPATAGSAEPAAEVAAAEAELLALVAEVDAAEAELLALVADVEA
jgi:hypothetical protein